MKISVIGSGNMGGALAKGWFKADKTVQLTVTAHSQKTLDAMSQACPGIKTTTDNCAAVQDADVVVLAVKPWLVEQVIGQIAPAMASKQPVVVSVAANIFVADLKCFLSQACGSEWTGDVFYVMPNIAAEFGQSMTFISASGSEESTTMVARLLEQVGQVQVCEERMIAAGMMMAGSGIAYVMRFLRAMMEGGVEMGFYPKVAQQIAMQTMRGAVTVLQETGLHPEAAIDKVTTPGGITIKGLNELDHAGFNSAVIRCLKAGLK